MEYGMDITQKPIGEAIFQKLIIERARGHI